MSDAGYADAGHAEAADADDVAAAANADADADAPSKRLRRNPHKAQRFTPGPKALGGGWAHRQGQPLCALQPTSLVGTFGREDSSAAAYLRGQRPSPVYESPEPPDGPDKTSQRGREGSPSQEVVDDSALPEAAGTDSDADAPALSTAVQMLPKTPHFNAISKAAGSQIDGADPSPLDGARSESQPELPPESPHQRIRDATASVFEQLHDFEATAAQIPPLPVPSPRQPPPPPTGAEATQATSWISSVPQYRPTAVVAAQDEAAT